MSGVPLTGTFVVTVGSARLPDRVAELLVGVVVEDNLLLPDAVLLRFRDPDRTVLSGSGIAIGSTVTVSAVGPHDPTPVTLIEAETTAVEAEFDATGNFTVVRGYDASHRLFRGRRTEAYRQMTASDIARKVAGRAGLGVGTVEPTSTVFPHVCQAGVSDWQFLTWLARQIGYEVAVRAGKLDFRAARLATDAPDGGGGVGADPLLLEQGGNLLRFRAVVTSSGQVGEVEVRGWDIGAKQALVAVAPARTTAAELPTTSPAELATVFGQPRHVSTSVPYRTQPEVESAAKALADEIGGSFAEIDGLATGNPALRAGASVRVEGMGAPFDGKYVVTTSRHGYDATTGYSTHFTVTGRQDRSLFGLTGAASGVSGAGIGGVVVATVTDVKDPQRAGRVKLAFPWLSDDYVSDWARTLQPGAGRDRGAMVVPEVGDEVLVAFEQGDIHQPYVVGGLYNGVDTPPAGGPPLVDDGSGAVNRRTLVSRRGHRLDLLDQDGQAEGVALRTADDRLTVVMDHTATQITVHSDGTVLIEARDGVTVDAAGGSIAFTGKDISLTATSGVTIDGGSGEVKLVAGTNLDLSANASATLHGGMVEVAATGPATVKGKPLALNPPGA